MVLPLETIELSKIHYTSCNYLNIKHTSVLQQCKISNGLSAASTRSHYFFSSICCFRVPAERWVEINHQCLKSRGNCALAHRDASRQLFKWDSLLLHPQRKKKKINHSSSHTISRTLYCQAIWQSLYSFKSVMYKI